MVRPLFDERLVKLPVKPPGVETENSGLQTAKYISGASESLVSLFPTPSTSTVPCITQNGTSLPMVLPSSQSAGHGKREPHSAY